MKSYLLQIVILIIVEVKVNAFWEQNVKIKKLYVRLCIKKSRGLLSFGGII